MKSWIPNKSDAADASTRERLMKAASGLFARKGFDRVSVREIAVASGCNLCLVSYYFGGKEKLYQRIFENFFERVGRHIDKSQAEHADTGKAISKQEFSAELRKNIRFILDEFTNEPEVKVMMHREVMDGFPRTQKLFDQHLIKVKTGMVGLYERAQKAGHIRPEIHVPTFSVLLNRSIEAYLVSYMFAKPIQEFAINPSKEPDRFIEQIEEVFLKGVLT